jgi:hypothetical protein
MQICLHQKASRQVDQVGRLDQVDRLEGRTEGPTDFFSPYVLSSLSPIVPPSHRPIVLLVQLAFHMPIAMHQVIVHQSGGLHVGVDDRAPHEFEPALFEILAQRVGFFACGGELIHSSPTIDLGLAADEAPDVLGERTEFVLHFQELSSVVDRREDLQTIADDARIEHELLDAFVGEASDFFRIKIGERFAVGVALAIDGDPTQSRLGAFEREELELLAVVPHRHAPLGIVVGDQFAASGVLPLAGSALPGH